MSHIEQDIKLNFDDVLLKPKRSTLSSRASVDLNRTITFRYSPKTFTGVPIMAANMDGVGTFSMAKVLQKYNCITVIKKHYSLDDWKEANGNAQVKETEKQLAIPDGVLDDEEDCEACTI